MVRLRDRRRNVELHFAGGSCERAKMDREDDADHGRVCTSTESTAGRSRTMGDQWSPESGEQ